MQAIQSTSTPLKTTKLLLAAPTFYPFYGGAEIRFRRYLPILRQYGIAPSVITGTPKAKKITSAHKLEDWYAKPYGAKLTVEFYKDIPINRYRLPDKPAKKRLAVFHEKIKEQILSNDKPDVIQFLSPFHSGAIDTFKLAHKHNIGTIVAYTLAKRAHPNIVKRWLQSKKLRQLFSVPDCIVVSSEEVKSYLIDRRINNRIEVIANGVDTDEFSPARNDEEKKRIRRKLGMHPDKKILLNVGTVHPRKGTDLLLGAFKLIAEQSKDVDLYIAGPEIDSADKSLGGFNQTIANLKADPDVSNRIHFVGLIDNVSEYMKASDVFVFPSREEGMGNVVMEAMATKLPVVITPYLGFPSVFGNNNKHYLLAEFNASSIANQVKQLISSSNLTQELIQNAKINIERNLLLDDSVQKFANLYTQIRGTR